MIRPLTSGERTVDPDASAPRTAPSRVAPGTNGHGRKGGRLGDPARAALSAEDIETCRRVLVHLREKLSEEIAALQVQEHRPVSPAEDAMLQRAIDAKRGLAYLVDRALKRMEQHTYGICAETGLPIPRWRILEQPWAG